MLLAVLVLCLGSTTFSEERVPADSRLKPHRELRDAYHPWVPPTSRVAWEQEAERIRRQILVACGLWPLPEKTPLEPVIHGLVDRGDYTVEKVSFASRPGLYVTGSLYRPRKTSGKVPGILCPHGHWPNGRFYDAGDGAARKELESGAEQFYSGARYPLQARMVQLARMGCVVFHYDMIGNADSTALPHREGFNDVAAALWMHDKLGLQTWNSIRALDFLESLPDVDPKRIGVTGASGGGTQTFLLCGIDPRPAAAFPAVMVSTGMQGGCNCENASYLRQDVNNIAFAALFAPRPQAMSGADDWTIEIESKGLPELKQVYALYNRPEFVHAVTYRQFKHNYNQVAREMMFNWFNEHLALNLPGPVRQTDFWPIPPAELSVYDEQHPKPKDELNAVELRKSLAESDRRTFEQLLAGSRDEYRRVIGGAAQVMLQPRQPSATFQKMRTEPLPGEIPCERQSGMTTTEGTGVQIPTLLLMPTGPKNGRLVCWFDGAGTSRLFNDRGAPRPEIERLLREGSTVVSADLFLTGRFLAADEPFTFKVNESDPGYTYGYNRPLLAERVRDILAVIEGARKSTGLGNVMLIGTGDAGVWTLLARSLLPADAVDSTSADLRGFSFAAIDSVLHPNMLPGALKYGDVGGLAALAFPANLSLFGVTAANAAAIAPLKVVYADDPDRLQLSEEDFNPD